MDISIITCTNNPRPSYLQRVLDSLSVQTLASPRWEYIFVDNASDCSPEVDFSGIETCIKINEPKVGKSNALLSAMAVCRGQMIIIVDDDNVLAPDYLEVAWKIYQDLPFLGVWGGQIFPEFEEPPAPELRPYTHLLTLMEFDRLEWTNLHTGPAVAGAGMCLRREVMTRFQQNAVENSMVTTLGRIGTAMPGIDDWETAMAACDLGLGMGRIPALKLSHLIPARRVEMSYLLSLQENAAYAYQRYVSARPELRSQRHWLRKGLSGWIEWLGELREKSTARHFKRAHRRGVRRADSDASSHTPQ